MAGTLQRMSGSLGVNHSSRLLLTLLQIVPERLVGKENHLLLKDTLKDY